ncbi:Zfp446 [Phodopus roborovskii]|uniref:Zfp446 protein n=1 Tax=Phodopus roborovskii TaxID=109678 RepID=A0AAV0A8I8_PHORO|nr:Zfp446 [Phodopus roborovskii]
MPSPLGSPHLSLRDSKTTIEETEAARLRFRGFCYEKVEGPREALSGLRELCHQWLQPESRSKEQMIELLVLEQFLGVLPSEIQAWVRGQRPGSPQDAAVLVEGLQHDPGQLLGWQERGPLDSSQKELYWGVMLEKYGTLVSQGEVLLPPVPCLPCPLLHVPPCMCWTPTGPPVQRPSIWLHLSPTRRYLPAHFCASPRVTELPHELLPNPASLPLLEPNIHVESELRPKQETPHAGPESLRSHLPEVGAIAGPELVQACTSSPSESQSLCKDPSGLSPTPLLEAPARPTPRKLYTCEQCGRSFDWKSLFIIHHRTHLGESGLERPPQVSREPAIRHSTGLPGYVCVECGRSFSWKSQLVIHRKSHVGQRRHFCRDCGCGFDWKFQLVIHRKIHQPEGP